MNDFWDIVGTEVSKIRKCVNLLKDYYKTQNNTLTCVLTICADEKYDALLSPAPCQLCGKRVVMCDCIQQQTFCDLTGRCRHLNNSKTSNKSW